MPSGLDFALRLAFFAVAPRFLVRLAEVYPVTGAIVQIALSLVVFVLSEAARGLATRSRIARMVLSAFLGFEEFYAANAPRPFLYYVFYPLLFPYWLTQPIARRELWLFKGYSLASLALLVVSLIAQYLTAFPPELDVRAFVPIGAKSLAMEALVVLVFLMPIATTVVHFHQRRAIGPLAVLFAVGLASTTAALVQVHSKRDPVVSYATRERVILRTAARPDAATHAQTAALHAAWARLPKDRTDVDIDGKVEPGPALDAAREALGALYKTDEAHSFDLWLASTGKKGTLVLYFEARRKKQPIWLALEGGTKVTRVESALPKGAFDAMWRLTQ